VCLRKELSVSQCLPKPPASRLHSQVGKGTYRPTCGCFCQALASFRCFVKEGICCVCLRKELSVSRSLPKPLASVATLEGRHGNYSFRPSGVFVSLRLPFVVLLKMHLLCALSNVCQSCVFILISNCGFLKQCPGNMKSFI